MLRVPRPSCRPHQGTRSHLAVARTRRDPTYCAFPLSRGSHTAGSHLQCVPTWPWLAHGGVPRTVHSHVPFALCATNSRGQCRVTRPHTHTHTYAQAHVHPCSHAQARSHRVARTRAFPRCPPQWNARKGAEAFAVLGWGFIWVRSFVRSFVFAQAARIVVDSKTDYVAACNSAE